MLYKERDAAQGVAIAICTDHRLELLNKAFVHRFDKALVKLRDLPRNVRCIGLGTIAHELLLREGKLHRVAVPVTRAERSRAIEVENDFLRMVAEVFVRSGTRYAFSGADVVTKRKIDGKGNSAELTRYRANRVADLAKTAGILR